MKSWGYCTANKEGNFEVSWEVEKTFIHKLFNIKTEFSYWTNNKTIKSSINRPHYDLGYFCEWFDNKGNRITSTKTLYKISQVINKSGYYNRKVS